MTLWVRLIAWLARVETRQWVAVGGSVVLHVAVLLGLRQEPPAVPETVSFEIALQPPEAEAVKRPKPKPQKLTKAAAKKTPKKLAKAKKPKSKREAKEPHTLEAAIKQETRPRKDAPAVSLPKTQMAETAEPKAVTAAAAKPTATPVENAATAPKPDRLTAPVAAAAVAPSLAEPGDVREPVAASQPAPTTAASTTTPTTTTTPGGRPGLSLAAAQSLSTSNSTGNASTGAEPAVGSVAQGANAGPGPATFSGSTGAGSGLNLAAGRGAQSHSASESAPLPGGEPQGVKLTASGTLSSLPELPQGKGALASGHLSLDAGAASPADGHGRGQALASAAAGSASVSPVSGPAAGPGKGGRGAAIERAAMPGSPLASGQAGSRLASAPVLGNSLNSNGDAGKTTQAERNSGKQVNAPTNARTAGKSGQTAGPAARSLALVPGEPGSGPQWAIVMAPVQVGMPVLVGNGRMPGQPQPGAGHVSARAKGDAQAGADESTGTQAGRARLAASVLGGLNAVVPPGLPGNGVGSGARSAAPQSGKTLHGGEASGASATAMGSQKPAEQKLVRAADSRVDTLDVLAPSNYCPLPIHAQPDNRAPQRQALEPANAVATLPTYASNNPSFVYPFMANVQGNEGKLIMRVQVLANGLPGQMLLKQGSGNAMLDKDAREQLSRWRFEPARKHGQAVTAWVDVPVIYRLSADRK